MDLKLIVLREQISGMAFKKLIANAGAAAIPQGGNGTFQSSPIVAQGTSSPAGSSTDLVTAAAPKPTVGVLPAPLTETSTPSLASQKPFSTAIVG